MNNPKKQEKIPSNQAQDISKQELQKAWETTARKLKESKNKKDQTIAKFLENNYIHPETGLITSKTRWSNRNTNCQPNEI